jgi:hypothetical protein
MGIIREAASGRTHGLEPEHVFGRIGPPRCSQTLDDPYVSGVHAVLRWTGRSWELKDLNSTNGTYLDGQRVNEAIPRRVYKGSRIGFGTRAGDWEIVETGQPRVTAPPPTLTVSVRASELATVEAARLQLSFAVSRDEEYVTLQATSGGCQIDLGARAYHYLLLTLARRRMADAARGFPDTSCGWVDVEELARDRTMAPPRLNVDVFRVRQHFRRLGLVDAESMVERRSRPPQLRIGTGKLSIAVL